MSEVFYFIIYPRGDTGRVTVIDLSYAVDYERGDWAAVTPENFEDRDDAIKAARQLSVTYDKEYSMFKSRYGGKDEYLGEFENNTLILKESK